MNIDDLRTIIELVASVSGDTKAVALTWIAAGVLKSLVGWGVISALTVFLARSIIAAVGRESRAQSAVTEINDLLGQPGSSYVCFASEHKAVVAAVRKLKDCHD